MQISIRKNGIEIDNTINKHVKNRIELSLGRFTAHVEKISVTLIAEKQFIKCITHVSLIGLPPIAIEGVDVDIYKAIDNSVDRAIRTASRRLDHSYKYYSELL